MTQASAPMSPAIKFVTGLVLAMIARCSWLPEKSALCCARCQALGCRLVLLSPRSRCL